MSEIDFLTGETVVDVQDASRIVFVADTRPEPRLYADVGDCECTDAEGAMLDLSDLTGRTVASATTDGGALTLHFTDGATLRCAPDQNYEAWQVVGGSPQHLVVCMPGGELAVWDKRHVPSPAEAEEVVAQLRELFGWNARVSEITEDGGIIVEPAPRDRGADD